MDRAAVTYNTYLKIDELLGLQQPRSDGPEHDELLFIVIHQVYELWFKEILHELDRVRALLEVNDAARAQHTMKRILTILKVLVAQLDILETMTPLEFQSFRQRLEQASGFQSDQFRQLEFVLGRRSQAALDRFPPGSRARAALTVRLHEPPLWQSFLRYLEREGYPIPTPRSTPTRPTRWRRRQSVQAVLIQVYRTDAEERRLVRAARRPRRRRAGVALPPREDGRAHHRGEAGHRRLGWRGLPAHTLQPPAFPDLWAIRANSLGTAARGPSSEPRRRCRSGRVDIAGGAT